MNKIRKIVKDMIGKNLSIDDDHKERELLKAKYPTQYLQSGDTRKACPECEHVLPKTGYGAQWIKTNRRCPYCGYKTKK